MKKVLISLIGTGKQASGDSAKNEYIGVDYQINDVLYKNETLISNAIIKHYSIDRVFFIGTNLSMWDNINYIFGGDDNYGFELLSKKENKSLCENDLVSLNETVNAFLNDSKSKCYIVEDGENEDELWNIFNKFIEIFEFIDDKDEVYFDITHLFRSLSVMSFVMGEFAKTYKKFKISGVFYGMLKSGKPSPLINLTIFFELLDWAKAIQNLKENGNSYKLMSLIQNSSEPKELKNAFSNFSNALSISDVGAMQNSIAQLKGKIELFEKHDSHIFKLISKDLKAFIKRFDISSLAKFQFELAKWYKDNNNYAFAYITLTEAAVSAICEKENLDAISKDDREKAKKILLDYKFSQSASKEKEKIYNAFTRVNSIRINIAHKLPSDGAHSKSQPKNSIENIQEYISTLSILFKG